MAFELGFLVGSLALLGLVLYITRVRGPSLPHEAMAEAEGKSESEKGPASDDRADPRPESPRAVETGIELCELCEENPASKTVNDLTVCAECDDDLFV